MYRGIIPSLVSGEWNMIIYPDPCFFHCFGSPKIQFLIISPCWRSQNLSNLVSEPVGGVVGGSTLEMCFCSKGRVSTIYLFRGGVIDHFYPFFIWSLKRCLRQAVFSLKLGNGRAFAWCIVIDLINKIQQASSDWEYCDNFNQAAKLHVVLLKGTSSKQRRVFRMDRVGNNLRPGQGLTTRPNGFDKVGKVGLFRLIFLVGKPWNHGKCEKFSVFVIL